MKSLSGVSDYINLAPFHHARFWFLVTAFLSIVLWDSEELWDEGLK